MMGSTSRLLPVSNRSAIRMSIKTCSLLSRSPLALRTVSPLHQSLLRRKSSCTTNIADAPSSIKEEEKKSCCHASTTSKAGNNAASSSSIASSLPITSYLFWSDPSTWKTASTNTFRCLIGCTLGDMSMLFYLQSAHPTLTPAIVMGIAMGSGILTSISLETIVLRFSKASRMTWEAAFKTATGMSLISMLTMEAVENGVDYHLMGWGNVNVADPAFWTATGLSALAGWSAPLPFNYWNLKRHGKSCH